MAVVTVMVFTVQFLRESLVRTEVRCGEDGTTPHGARGTGQAARKWAEFEEPIPACSLIWDNCAGFGSDGGDGGSDSIHSGNQRKGILVWERERRQRY